MGSITLREAFEKWGDELTGYAAAIGPGHEAADVVAEAFHRLLREHDADGARWNGAIDPRAYLFRCVLNSARMRARSESRRRVRDTRFAAAPEGCGVDLLSDPAIVAAVNGLSVRQRAVVYHAYWEDLSVDQIADLLDISPGSVKRHLARARAALREVLA